MVLFAGTYLTDLSPSQEKDKIKYNNWNNESFGLDQKVEAAIKVTIPRKRLKRYTVNRRIIYVKKSGVDLRIYPHEFIVCKWN